MSGQVSRGSAGEYSDISHLKLKQNCILIVKIYAIFNVVNPSELEFLKAVVNFASTIQTIFSYMSSFYDDCGCVERESSSVVSDSVQPNRQQPTRLPHPWDSPGKNTGVSCHFLLQCMKWKVKVKSLSRVWPSATPWTAAHQAPPSMGFSRQEYYIVHGILQAGVGSLSLLQGIFPTQGSNPYLPHCRWILYQLTTREAQEYWSR